MELRQLLAQRRMIRSFDGTPVDLEWLDECCATALWSPTAGNSAGVRFYTVAAQRVASFFDVATDEEWRSTARRAGGLMRAGAVVLVTCRSQDYLRRYAEHDKSNSGLDEIEGWPVPYWQTDAAMATMALLLLIEESGWQATMWGNFGRSGRLLEWAHISDEELFATVLVGKSDGHYVPSASLTREVPSRASRVRRVQP
jgi:nitroreductase